MSGYTIRPARRGDVPAILALWQELMDFHATLDPRFRLHPKGARNWRMTVRAWIDATDSAVFVAEAEGALVGFIAGLDREGPAVFLEPRFGHITDVAVTEAWRRRGVGTALYRSLVQWFQARGLTCFRVHVAHRNPVSQAFWRAVGCSDFVEQMWGDIS